jgi:chromosome segregation ATPase
MADDLNAEQEQRSAAAEAAPSDTGRPQSQDTIPLAEHRRAVDELRKIQGGLQSALERTRRELDELRKQTTSTESEKQELLGQIAEYEGKLAEVQQQLERLAAERQQLEAEARRARLIATRFPHLSPLLEAGALPPYTTDEEYEGALQRISDALAKSAEQIAASRMAGAKPAASPPARSTSSPEDIKRAMIAALEEGDMERYNRLREEWYSAVLS